MQKRGFVMLGIALALAVLTTMFAGQWINGKEPKTDNRDSGTVTVVVAKNPLEFGALVRPENLKTLRWPGTALPAGTFRSVEQLVEKGKERYVLRRIEANEPILESKVSGFGGRASLSAIISKDMRAATIRVNDVNGVAGFVLPGDRVDVLITRDLKSGSSGARSRNPSNLVANVLLQNVKVLGIDQQADESKDKPSVAKAVTLEVTAKQAQKLVLAEKIGALSLALRNAENAIETSTTTIGLGDLGFSEGNDLRRNGQKTSAVRKVPTPSVKVFRGMKPSVYRVAKEPRQPFPASRGSVSVTRPEANAARRASEPVVRRAAPTTPSARGDHVREAERATSAPIPLYRPPTINGGDQEAKAQ